MSYGHKARDVFTGVNMTRQMYINVCKSMTTESQTSPTSLEEDGRQYGHGARRDHQDEQGCETGGDKCEIIGKGGDEAVEKKSVELQCFHRGPKQVTSRPNCLKGLWRMEILETLCIEILDEEYNGVKEKFYQRVLSV